MVFSDLFVQGFKKYWFLWKGKLSGGKEGEYNLDSKTYRIKKEDNLSLIIM